MNPTQDWRSDFREMFSEQTPMSQAILGALQYRGFNDAGKYLDPDIADAVLPVLEDFIESLIERGRLQGIEEAKGCVPKKLELPEDKNEYTEKGYCSEDGFNSCRTLTLRALDKLKGE